MDLYEIWALAKRLNISYEDMKQMSFVSLMNILISTTDNQKEEATQEDINKLLG